MGATLRRRAFLSGRHVIRSVFFRLMISYVSLVFAVAVGTSVVSYAFFQGQYNGELERIHLFMVRNIEQELTSRIVDTTKRIYLDCATELLRGSGDFFGEEDTAPGNFARLDTTHKTLGALMGRYGEVVEGVSLYFRKADLILSFPWGVHFRDSEGGLQGFEPFREYLAQPESALWTHGSETAPRTFRSFPILTTPADCTVVVSVEVREDEIRRIISATPINDAGATYVIDAGGGLVCSSANASWSESLGAEFRRISEETGNGKSTRLRAGRIVRAGRIQSIVATVPISDTGWFLANVTPISLLYRKGDSIRGILAMICLASVLLGIGVSALLTARVYNPLERLIGRVRRIFGAELPPPAEADDEYRILDYAIEGLSSRMGELAATLERSRPLIKHEVAVALLTGDVSQIGDPEVTLDALGIPDFPVRSVACLFRIGTASGDPRRMENRLLRYRVAEELERGTDRFVLACVLADGSVAVIAALPGAAAAAGAVASAAPAAAARSDLDEVGRLIADLRSRCDVPVSVCIGTVADSFDGIKSSWDAALKTAEYAFFFPERTVLSAADGLLAREGRSAEMPAEIFADLAEGTRRGDLVLTDAALRAATDFVRSASASAEACRGELARLARSMAVAQAEAFPAAAAEFRGRAERLALDSTDMDEFRNAVRASVADYRERLAAPPDERVAVVLAEVSRIIERDLSGDLSLPRLGEAVGLSPGYLGKMFKAAKGVHLVDYVTERRLTEAARLLSETGDDVQDIGRSVGFNTPAYFIRRFKQRYGRTPYEYRRTAANKPKPE